MRIFSKQSAAMVLVLAAGSMTGGCGSHGRDSYLMPKDAVIAKLAGAAKQYETIGGETRTIRVTGRSGDTLSFILTVDRADGDPRLCQAVVEAIDSNWTRVSPKCPERANAAGNAVSETHELEVGEFVAAVLHNSEIDGVMVAKRSAAVATGTGGAIENEVIAADLAYREAASQSAPAAP